MVGGIARGGGVGSAHEDLGATVLHLCEHSCYGADRDEELIELLAGLVARPNCTRARPDSGAPVSLSRVMKASARRWRMPPTEDLMTAWG